MGSECVAFEVKKRDWLTGESQGLTWVGRAMNQSLHDSASKADSPKNRAEEIAFILRDEILIGQYRAGERLPSERDLVARFNSNRGAVREATKILSELGLVSIQPGGARIVAVEQATLAVLGPLLDMREEVRPQLVIEFVEVFSALVALSARLAMSQATEQERHQLAAILDRFDPETESTDIRSIMAEFMQASIDIHNNLVLRLIGNGLRSQIMGRLDQTTSDRASDRAFIDAMREGVLSSNADLLATTVIRHFDEARNRLIEQAEISPSLFVQSGKGSRHEHTQPSHQDFSHTADSCACLCCRGWNHHDTSNA